MADFSRKTDQFGFFHFVQGFRTGVDHGKGTPSIFEPSQNNTMIRFAGSSMPDHIGFDGQQSFGGRNRFRQFPGIKIRKLLWQIRGQYIYFLQVRL